MLSSQTPASPRTTSLSKAAIFCFFAACAGFCLILPVWIGLSVGDFRRALWSYNGATIALSYFDTGFARRELEGTLIRMFSPDPMVGGLVFHLTACLALVVLVFLVTLKSSIPDRNRLAVGAVFMAVLVNLAVDIGRADPAILACGVVAAWGARTGRWITVAVAASVALAFHEAGVIVLAPMVLCVAWEHGTWRKGAASRAVAIVVGVLGLVAYLLALQAHPDVWAVGRHIHAKFLDPKLADLSVYYTLSGARGVASILCQKRLDGEYLSKVVKGAVLIALLSLVLRPRHRLTTLAAALAPFLFLAAIAVDIGRWGTFGAFIVAIMATVDGFGAGDDQVAPLPPLNVLFALIAVVLMVMRPTLIVLGDPLPMIPNFLYGSGSRTFDALKAATQCDPEWKAFIGLPN